MLTVGSAGAATTNNARSCYNNMQMSKEIVMKMQQYVSCTYHQATRMSVF
jgi:hypothetical protein